ncbi:hypothetical protein FGB62_14g039 [Gracilaria domingensis]|nr:hypothetical protein FGB62_14g039 [Gracilaria domingensis]
MMHNRNFTLVPWIGESGHINVEKPQPLGRRGRRRRRRFKLQRSYPSDWTMSSQLKFGRDGEIYALHQLHHYATGGGVRPRNIVKVDLRVTDGEDIRSIVESQKITPILSPKWIEVAAKEMGRAWGEDRSRIGEIAKTIYEAHADRIRKEREDRLKRYANRRRYNNHLYRRLWGEAAHRMIVNSIGNVSSRVVHEHQTVT